MRLWKVAKGLIVRVVTKFLPRRPASRSAGRWPGKSERFTGRPQPSMPNSMPNMAFRSVGGDLEEERYRSLVSVREVVRPATFSSQFAAGSMPTSCENRRRRARSPGPCHASLALTSIPRARTPEVLERLQGRSREGWRGRPDVGRAGGTMKRCTLGCPPHGTRPRGRMPHRRYPTTGNQTSAHTAAPSKCAAM